MYEVKSTVKTWRDFKKQNHNICYMQKDTTNPMKKDYLFIFFDLVTRQDESLSEDLDANVQKVNLCVSKQYCWKCINNEDYCDICNERTHIFRLYPIVKFMAFIMKVRKQFKSVCVIANNGRGFNFQFLMKYIFGKHQIYSKSHNPRNKSSPDAYRQRSFYRIAKLLSYVAVSSTVTPPSWEEEGLFSSSVHHLSQPNYGIITVVLSRLNVWQKLSKFQ